MFTLNTEDTPGVISDKQFLKFWLKYDIMTSSDVTWFILAYFHPNVTENADISINCYPNIIVSKERGHSFKWGIKL